MSSKRPPLRDPNDDHVAELAIAAGCDAIVTYDHRDFAALTQFELEVIRELGRGGEAVGIDDGRLPGDASEARLT